MGRKDAPVAVSKSSASAPAVTASNNARKSSVLKSAFTPSQFQLHLFASVIQSFDSHQLRIHDTSTGRLRSQHETKSKITSLDWGFYGSAYRERQQSKKKRKREQTSNDGAVVAYGTDTSQICMFSPAEGRVVGTLSGGHERGIKAFKFSPTDYLQAWSIGEDANLIQWDLLKDQPIRTINLPDPTISLLASPCQVAPEILCASSTPFAIDITSSDDFRIDRFDSFKNTIHSLCRSDDYQTFLAADSDRYINIYSISEKKLSRTLVASSGVTAVALSSPPKDAPDYIRRQQMLCAITRDGAVELFPHPFTESKAINGDLKSSRKNLTRKASASVRLVSPDSKTKSVPIVAAFLQGSDLVIVSADGGVDLAFQKVRWQDEGNGELLFDGVKEVVKVKSASTLNTATLNGVKDTGKTRVDESKTVVINGGAGGPSVADAIELSSGESEDDVDEDDSGDEASAKADNKEEDEEADEDEDSSEASGSDEEMPDAEEKDAQEDKEEPSFGDLLAARHPTEISIPAALPADTTALAIPKVPAMALPAGMSLSTVLTQSLRTNDTSLLEAVLHTTDASIVKSTIQRLDSTLAGLLLSKLAERLASRPGRYGHLITWVQWTCIAHGGAIASMPDVISKVKTLYAVLNERMRTLDDLLVLKGKLDLLDAQVQFRKSIAAQRGEREAGQGQPGVILLEGQDNWDSDDDLDEDGFTVRPTKRARRGTKLDDLIGASHEDEDDEEDVEDDEILANGVESSDEEEEEEDDDDDDEILANGVESSDEEEEEEDDDDDDDDEDDDEEESDEEGLPNGTRLVDDEASVSSAGESDPDDVAPSPAEAASSSASSVSGSDDESGEGEDGEEDEGSDLDSFINDGSVDFEEEADDDDGNEIKVAGDNSDGEGEDEDEDNEDVEEPEPEPEPEPMPLLKPSKSKPQRDAMDLDVGFNITSAKKSKARSEKKDRPLKKNRH
ncbi:putative small nucleolar ribonucleoprotein complex component (Utp5) [Cladophialophora carrionii]|uniref:Putative small nucleolar ribonucleoprotein complex component (Utp5) n=1 Tax=Cladophialophora carrionii TaxID=86049 RepID=A0A1C1CHX8_9EURO|nr:putative small nucleolar ribonucleoprotein complex component (Utp5) [Cladophialophora carrionii]